MGTNINVHALLLSDGRLFHSIMPGTDGQSCKDFVEHHINHIRDFTIVHDGLPSNKMHAMQEKWRSKGAKTLCLPPSSCALSSVETVFAIIKEKFRKWVNCSIPITQALAEAEIPKLFDTLTRSQCRKICTSVLPIYHQVMQGHPV